MPPGGQSIPQLHRLPVVAEGPRADGQWRGETGNGCEVLARSHASSLFFCDGKQVNTIDFVSAVTSEAAASCSRHTFFLSTRPRSAVVSAHAACFPTLRQSAELSQLSTLCLCPGPRRTSFKQMVRLENGLGCSGSPGASGCHQWEEMFL